MVVTVHGGHGRNARNLVEAEQKQQPGRVLILRHQMEGNLVM